MNADTERQALPTQQRKPLRLDLLDRHPNFKNHVSVISPPSLARWLVY
jgi:hypothetical protein